ncbi:MAG: SpoIID/LytB domain-containing protein, partial [Anaerolineae bacterium]
MVLLAGGVFLLACAVWPAWAAPAPGERRLTTGGDALFVAWADAETLLFTRPGAPASGGNGSLWAVSLRTGRTARVPEGAAAPTPSPGAPKGGWTVDLRPDGLWVRGPAGEERLAAQATAPVWSPEGDRLAFLAWEEPTQPCLWVWEAASASDRCLFQAVQGYLSPPDWAPDGTSLLVSVTPAGAETSSFSEVWRVAADGSGAVRLTWDGEEQSEPRWSPDGRWIVFRRGGDLWAMPAPAEGAAGPAAPAETPPPSSTPVLAARAEAVALAQKRPPATIRVLHRAENIYRASVPPGQIDIFDFETYVRHVVPYEMPASWNAEALRAQAVAARTYAWHRVLARTGEAWDVTDWTDTQVMGPNTHPASDEAVFATRGQYVAYGGEVISAMYSAQNGSPTLWSPWGTPYLQAVDDPVCFGEERRGHGLGLSQVGAARWADWHGWTYQQVLTHYYTGVTVELPQGTSPDLTPPLAQLVAPWRHWYLRSLILSLSANASDDLSGVAEVEFRARYRVGGSTVETLLGTDTDGSDGWTFLWDLSALPPQPRDGGLEVRVQARDRAGNPSQDAGWVPLGLDPLPPTGTVSPLSSVVTTTTLPLAVAAADAGPSGLLGVGVSAGWSWEGEDLPHWPGTGEAVGDPQALNGVAWCGRAGTHAAGYWYGPYTGALRPGRAYRALFRLRVGDITHSGILALLDVVDQAGARLLGIRRVRGTDFLAPDAYQEFPVDFVYPWGDANGLEFRVWFGAVGNLCLDRVQVVTFPEAPAGGRVLAPLWGPPGPRAFVARLVDGAGNAAPDLPFSVTLVDETPPGPWTGFSPSGWVSTTLSPLCSVQVEDPLSGLDLPTAAYQVSSDGGATWGPWTPASAQALLSPYWPHTLAAAPAFPGEGAHWVRFRIGDGAGNLGLSPAFPVRIDRTPPRTWAVSPPVSASQEFSVRWGGEDALSGVASYDVEVREGGSGPWLRWYSATAATEGTYVGEPGHTYYFRVRGRDRAGNEGAFPAA